jgi:hypothetical protein
MEENVLRLQNMRKTYLSINSPAELDQQHAGGAATSIERGGWVGNMSGPCR